MLNALGEIVGAGGALGGTAAVAELQTSLGSLAKVTGRADLNVGTSGDVTPATVAAIASILGDLKGLPDSIKTTLELALPWAMTSSSYMAQAQAAIEQYAPTLTPLVLDLIHRLTSSAEVPAPTDSGLSPFELLVKQTSAQLPSYRAPIAAQPEPLVINPDLYKKNFFRLSNVWMWATLGAVVVGGAVTYRFVRG